MEINNIVEHIIQAVRNSESTNRGVGLEPLIIEFVDEIEGLSPDERNKRINSITSYYMEILDRTANVNTAYRVTRQWAMGIYVQNYAQKKRKEYGL